MNDSKTAIQIFRADMTANKRPAMTDAELREAHAAGDYRGMVESVLPLIFKSVGARRPADRDPVELSDMLQNAAAACMVAAASWDPDGGVSWPSYAARTAEREAGRTLARNDIRADDALAYGVPLDYRESGMPTADDYTGEQYEDASEGDAYMATQEGADPADIVVSRQQRERILAAVRSLPDRQREAAELVLLQERTVREAGEIMGVSGQQVHRLVNKAKFAIIQRLT